MSVSDNQVIRQCLSLLPLQEFVSPLLDYRKQKLMTENILKIFLTAQLLQWPSLDYIEKQIRSDELYQTEFGVSSISKSQLSRRMNDIPVEVTESVFLAVVQQLQAHTSPKKVGTTSLAIVDSTGIRLPLNLAHWTNVTKHRSGIKVHTRLLVIDKHAPYPDKIVASTGKVSDQEGADLLVVDPNVLYVMDRGYVCYSRMQNWVNTNIEFVIRVNLHHYAEVLEEHPLPEASPRIKRDATVRMGKNFRTEMTSPLRLIEFYDDQGRFYRIVTTRWDLTAEEITDIYRQRWAIELFFKWMKQHLQFARLYSHQPEAVWNHIFIALVAYGLSYLLTLNTQTEVSIWEMVSLIRIYALKRWSALEAELYRKPSKQSKGRQKTGSPPRQHEVVASDVILVKKSGKKRKKSSKKSKR